MQRQPSIVVAIEQQDCGRTIRRADIQAQDADAAPTLRVEDSERHPGFHEPEIAPYSPIRVGEYESFGSELLRRSLAIPSGSDEEDGTDPDCDGPNLPKPSRPPPRNRSLNDAQLCRPKPVSLCNWPDMGMCLSGGLFANCITGAQGYAKHLEGRLLQLASQRKLAASQKELVRVFHRTRHPDRGPRPRRRPSPPPSSPPPPPPRPPPKPPPWAGGWLGSSRPQSGLALLTNLGSGRAQPPAADTGLTGFRVSGFRVESWSFAIPRKRKSPPWRIDGRFSIIEGWPTVRRRFVSSANGEYSPDRVPGKKGSGTRQE